MPKGSDSNLSSIKHVSVNTLIPYASNSRTHSQEQVAQIAASIKEFGFTNPILTDGKNGIIAGHGRLEAARLLGLETVPTIELSHLTKAQRKAYIIADNKLALNAGWDIETLKAELEGLKELDYDLGLTGFDPSELAGILDKHEGLTDPDAVPEPPKEPISVLGDVWILGRHRLVCGDCTDADTVAKCLAGVKPHLMVTDPPYGVEYDPSWRGKGGAQGVVLNDDRADWREAWSLFPGDVAYVWSAPGPLQCSSYDSLEAVGLMPKQQIIWAKSSHVFGRGHYHYQHEPCWYAVRKKQGATGHWQGDRKQSTVWNIDKPMKSETGHSTQKPVECMKRPIENNSSPGQAVYEPFSGSGTTIIAAEMTGRACYAIELNPTYVDVAVKRWEDFTGEKATRADHLHSAA
jgi:DNA modification methylase